MASADNATPAERVPQGVEAATQLIKGRDTTDILVLVLLPAGAIGGLYTFGILSIKNMLIGFGLVGLINYGIFKIIPTEESVAYWLQSYINYKRSNKVLMKKGVNPDSIDDSFTVNTEETGGRNISEQNPEDAFTPDESTEELTKVEKIDTYNDVIKLTSGDAITALRVVGMERNLIDTDIKQKATNSYNNFLRSTDFDTTIRCTSTEYPIDSEVDRYEQRLQDKDINNLPVLKRVIRTKKQFIDTRIRSLGMNNRQFYVFVRVSPSEQSIDSGGPFNLSFIDPNSPIGGFLSSQLGSSSDGKTEEENLIEMVTSQRRSAQSSINRIRQCTTKPVDGEELARLTREYFCEEGGGIDGWEQSTPVTVDEGTLTTAKEVEA